MHAAIAADTAENESDQVLLKVSLMKQLRCAYVFLYFTSAEGSKTALPKVPFREGSVVDLSHMFWGFIPDSEAFQ